MQDMEEVMTPQSTTPNKRDLEEILLKMGNDILHSHGEKAIWLGGKTLKKATQQIQNLITKSRIDEAKRALNDYNTLEEYRHNPSMELKPGNLKLLDRISELESTLKSGVEAQSKSKGNK